MMPSPDHGTGSGVTKHSILISGARFALAVVILTLLCQTTVLAQNPTLVATPSSLVFHALTGGPDPPPQTLVLSLSNFDTTMWYAYGTWAGVSFTPTDGFTPATMVVRVNLIGRPAGLYRDTIWVYWEDTLAAPLKVPVETRIAALPYSDSDFVKLVPPVVNLSSPSVETTFALALYVDLASTLGAIAIPLRYDGHPGLLVDTSVTSPPDLVGVSLGPAGRDTAWTITTSLLDPDLKTLLLGFVSFSQVLPVRDTLAYVHFRIDSTDISARIWVDSTTIGSNQLSITSTSALEYTPGWSPTEIRIGYQPKPPVICLSTRYVHFEAQADGVLPSAQTFSITNCGEGEFGWMVTHTAPWLALSSQTGQGESTLITVSVVTTDLPAGEYSDTLVVASDASSNSPQVIAVTYSILPAPVLVDSLYILPDTIRIRGPFADTGFTMTVDLANQRWLAAVTVPLSLTGLPALRLDSNYQFVEDCPGITWHVAGDHPAWTIRTCNVDHEARTLLFGFISFSSYPPLQGPLVALHFVLDSSDAGGMARLDSSTVFNEHLRVADVQATRYTPAWRPGIIIVGDSLPSPQICLETDSLYFAAPVLGGLPPDQEIVFHNCRSGELPWSISDNAGWLELTPASGLHAEARVTAHVNTTQLPTGVHWAIVTIRNQAVNTDELHLRVSYRLDSRDSKLYLWPDNHSLPGNRDTTFTVSVVMREVSGLQAVAIAVPLSYAGAGANVWLDTLVDDGFGNQGVTQGPLGASSAWNIRTALADPVLHTVLVAYISFGEGLAGPQHDTLAVLHFGVSAQPGTQLFTIDTTTIPPGQRFGIVDVNAMDVAVEWSGATVSIGTTGLSEDLDLPSGFALAQNAPNPFNAGTRIEFAIPARAVAAPVTISVHDLLGRRVRTLVDGVIPAGGHKVNWDGTDDRGAPVASGVYFIVLEAESVRVVKKALLLR